MYAVVRRYEGVTDPQKVAKMGGGLCAHHQRNARIRGLLLVDAGDGVMVSTSVFEHKEAEEQSTLGRERLWGSI